MKIKDKKTYIVEQYDNGETLRTSVVTCMACELPLHLPLRPFVFKKTQYRGATDNESLF